MRYVTIPEDVLVRDPVTDLPMKAADGSERKITFGEFVKTATAIAAQKGAADTLLLAEIRESLGTRTAGTEWDLSDEWHKVLIDNTKRIIGWNAAELFSVVPFIRALTDAPSKRAPRFSDAAAQRQGGEGL